MMASNRNNGNKTQGNNNLTLATALPIIYRRAADSWGYEASPPEINSTNTRWDVRSRPMSPSSMCSRRGLQEVGIILSRVFTADALAEFARMPSTSFLSLLSSGNGKEQQTDSAINNLETTVGRVRTQQSTSGGQWKIRVKKGRWCFCFYNVEKVHRSICFDLLATVLN